MLLQLILLFVIACLAQTQDYGADPNAPSYPDYAANTNPPEYPNYGTYPETAEPQPQYPDYTYVETVETSTETTTPSTTTTTTRIPRRRQTISRRLNPTRRQSWARQGNRVVRLYYLPSNAWPYDAGSFYRARMVRSRVVTPTPTRRQQWRYRIVRQWYL